MNRQLLGLTTWIKEVAFDCESTQRNARDPKTFT